MQNKICDRIIEEAEYIIKTNGTVRSIAPIFGVSKSTVHNDLTKTLQKLDTDLYQRVKKVLETNLKERHLRGGEATKAKYRANKEESKSGRKKFFQFLKLFKRKKQKK